MKVLTEEQKRAIAINFLESGWIEEFQADILKSGNSVDNRHRYFAIGQLKMFLIRKISREKEK